MESEGGELRRKRSLTDDVFSRLSAGLRFDRGPNGMALDVMRRRKRVRGEGADVPCAPLDFFAAAEGSRGTKKRLVKHDPRSANSASSVVSSTSSSSSVGSFDEDVSEKRMTALREEDWTSFRKRLRVRVKGSDVRHPMVAFTAEGLSKGMASEQAKQMARLICENVEASNYVEPTPIQMEAIPVLLRGRDVLGCAPTGSGKTAAFLLPTIVRLAEALKRKTQKRVISSLVLVPTRELASQILREFERMSDGGRKFRSGILKKEGEHGLDLAVSTPHRVAKLLASNALDLSSLRVLILDEADKLFELGFLKDVDEILSKCSEKAQRAMFSATMLPQIEELAQTALRDPVSIIVGTANAAASTIDQKLIFAGQEHGKIIGLRQLSQDGELVPPTLIFVQTKERAKELHEELVYEGMKVDVIHSDRPQKQRDLVVEKFRRGEVWSLICTDLLGRGIDFKGVNCVVNYDFPTSAVGYVHRVGRTGRQKRRGKAFTFFTLDDVDSLRSIANVVRLSGCEVPNWMLKLKKPSTKQRKQLERNPPSR